MTMNLPPRIILAAAGFLISGFMLISKLINPTIIHITIENGDTKILPVLESFTFSDVMVVIFANTILIFTAIYIWNYNNNTNNNSELEKLNEEKQAIENEKQKMELERGKWQHTLKTLKDDEKVIYETIFAEGGIIYQNELIEKTGFYAAKTTRCLDALENKGLIKRKRRGLHNIVSL